MAALLDLACTLCKEDYSDYASPRNFECGHSICSLCLKKLTEFSKLCPECRRKSKGKCMCDFRINYPVLRLSRMKAFANLDENGTQGPKLIIRQPDSKPLESAGTCPSHGASLFFMCVHCHVLVCRDCLVMDHLDPPRGLCVILSIQQAKNKIKKSHQKVLETYLMDAEKTTKVLEYIVGGCVNVKKYLKKEANKGNNDFDGCIEEINVQQKEAQLQIFVVEDLVEDMIETLEKVKDANSCEDIMAVDEDSLICESDFEKNTRKSREMEPQIFLHPFLNGKKNLKELGEAGKSVYAVLDEDGKIKRSRLVFKDDHILLYSLRDGRPPCDCVSLPFEVIRAAVPLDSPTVFLEIGWKGGKWKDQVFIRMFGNTPRGRQSALLCSGELGPSYRNSALWGWGLDSTAPTSKLKGGDYENNDGTGGKAIVDDIVDGHDNNIVTGDIYETKPDVYLFAGWPPDEQWRLGSFIIHLYEIGNFDYVHGIVTRGINLINEIKYSYKMEFKPLVMDCGLVIPYDIVAESDNDDDDEEEDLSESESESESE